MLYIFHVDTGTMMTFDMNLAMERVSILQGVITRACRIPEDKQVLLISGGESLHPDNTVSKYHAGTDTNPIFLFSKSTIESAVPPSPSVNYGSDIDLQGQVEGSLLMPPAYETVVSRAQLALQFHEVDLEELRACERLIHDQHLQQQGWAAVVANLEDVTSELQQRAVTFHETYKEYLEERQTFKELITSVTESLQLLSKIPVLSCLLTFCQTIRRSESAEESSSTPSLFDWISSQDANHTLHDMVEQCGKAIEQLDQKLDESLKQELELLLKDVQNESMKEVKGLEDRLYGLDQIISSARKIVKEQDDLAQGFVKNQNRLSNLRDRSILPDLCSSHRSQLMEMMKNHKRLRDIKKKCRMAKEELSVNLHTRLRWVMYVEKKICDVDGKLTIYLGNLKRLRKRLDILQQVHDAPTVYAQLVIEVVRRRQFSAKFLSWATTLAEDSARLHTEEVKRRDTFLRVIGHHFLQAMFQGLEDYPPAFATEAPEVFDSGLPEITADDIKSLKDSVPELSGVLSVPAEDELFVALVNASDTSVQWVDGTSHSPVVPRRFHSDPCAENHRDNLQPYSIEMGSVSLGDQFEECEEEGEIVKKPGFEVEPTPPEKEFLLPKSLSEELTVEIKESQPVKDLQAAVSEDSKPKEIATAVSPEIPEPTSFGVRSRRRSSKQLTDTSPDMETSQEFTTADFYFDESMPSSIETPPKTSTESKADLEQAVIAEKQANVKLQQQLKEVTKRCSNCEKVLKALHDYFGKDLTLLKTCAGELKREQVDSVQKVRQEMEEMKQKVIDIVHSYDRNVADQKKVEVEKAVQEKLDTESAMNEKLKLESEKLKEVEVAMDKLKNEAEDREQKLLSEIEEKEKLNETRLEELKTKYDSEIKELNQKYELEVEVEVDKAKAEFAESIGNLEKEIDTKDIIITEKESAIQKLEKDKIKLEETLMDKFQVEKEQICDILGKEYKENLEKALKEHEEKLEVMKQSVIAELSEKHEQETEHKLEELKQSLMVEKAKAIEMTQSTLTVEYEKVADEIKSKLVEEKIAEIEKCKSDMEAKFQDDLGKLSAEFNKEKEKLVTELDVYRNKVYITGEMQTSLSVFNTACIDTQTNPAPTTLHSQAQTEILDQSSASIQTISSELMHLAIQTDTVETASSDNQTEKAQVAEYSIQTDEKKVDHIFVQTESCATGCVKENSCYGETQTDLLNDGNEEIEAKLNDMKKQVQEEFQKKLQDIEKTHEEEINHLISQIEKEKEDALHLKTSLTSMTGDKQTKFNEAVNRVSREKDRVIEELKIKESKVAEEIRQYKEQIKQLKEEKTKAEDVKERALAFLKDKEASQRHLESELAAAQKQVQQFQEQIQSLGSDSSEADVAKSSPSVVQISDPDVQQRIKDLEDVVRLKDEELSRMQQKVMELSMSASTRSLVQDKVSITSCQVGDLVLLCLDERLDQYVVFTVGTTLHFLHTECLAPLGLKTETGEAKKQWLIAEVIDKEYCQAKKSNNRFKVPVGTKFYRVRAKRWTRETSQSPNKKSDTASAPL